MNAAQQRSIDVSKQLSGPWFNQLGSRLDLQAGDDGQLTGTIRSPVGGVEGSHPVTGFFDVGSDRGTRAIGFAASWTPTHSVTVWSGHYHGSDDVILTTWLLSGNTPGSSAWRSTLIGHDRFSRSPSDGGTADTGSSAPEV